MCTPAAIPYAIAAIAAIGGTAVQAKATSAAANTQASIDRQNQAITALQARQAIDSGELDAQAKRREINAMIGHQRAAAAASGVTINEGSALDIQSQTAAFGEDDIMRIRQNALRQAWGYKVQGVNYGNDASAAIAAGRNQRNATIIGGIGQLASIGAAGYGAGAFGSGGATAATTPFKTASGYTQRLPTGY